MSSFRVHFYVIMHFSIVNINNKYINKYYHLRLINAYNQSSSNYDLKSYLPNLSTRAKPTKHSQC